MTSEQRRENYLCDITYVTNSELRFDYLRDNFATSVNELVMRKFNFYVIDEVDSTLIDEARTPLIILGPADKPSDRYYKAAKIAAAFEREIHYTVDEKQKIVLLTEQGYADEEEILDVKDLYDPREQWASYLLNAIKEKELFLRDVNYIIRGKEVLIVDEFTGRVMQGRRWSDRLHQAVEAKEGLPIQNETGCSHLKGRRVGSSLHLDVNIEVDPFYNVSVAHEVEENVRDEIWKSHPEVAEVFIHTEPSFSNVSLNKMDQQKNMKGADHLKSNVCSNDKHIEDITSALLTTKFA